MNSGLGHNTKKGGNKSTELYILRVLNQIFATLVSILNKPPLTSQLFIAGAGQTVFTPVVTPTSLTFAYSGGATYSVGNGLNVVGADVVFTLPFSGGEVVDIRTP
jgi:hypothetical protein